MSASNHESLIAAVVGNTSMQIGVFAHLEGIPLPEPNLTLATPADDPDFELIASNLSGPPAMWVVSSVFRRGERRLNRWVRKHRQHDGYLRLRYTDFPLRLALDQPESVGTDRLAGAVAANAIRSPDRGAIIVDAGTAITVDAVSADGAFLGGAILPGLDMSATALARATDRLPRVDINIRGAAPAVLGKNTVGAIQSGLFWGTIGAIERLCQDLELGLGSPADLILTGGGISGLVDNIRRSGTYIPNLVVRGVALASTGLV